jgi:hypothetical protein
MYDAFCSAYLLRTFLFILMLQAEMDFDFFSYNNGMFKWQLNQDRRGPRPLPNICNLSDPLPPPPTSSRYKPP